MIHKIFLKQIKINSLFGKCNILWNLRKDVNILGGKNGGGKTTVLNGIYELITKGCVSEKANDDLYSSIELSFSNNARLCWFKEKDAFNEFIEKSDSSKIIVDRHKHSIWVLENDSDQPPKINVVFFHTFEQNLSEGIDMTSKMINKNYNLSYLDLHIRRELEKRNKSYLKTMSQIVKETSEGQSTRSDSQRAIEDYTKLFEAIKEFIPYFDLLEETDENPYIITKEGIHIPLENLSSGEKQIMLLLLKVCNNINESNLLLADEPDLGMHIEWKEKLISALHHLNPSLQIIVTTHSPSLIEGWYDSVKEMSELCEPLER